MRKPRLGVFLVDFSRSQQTSRQKPRKQATANRFFNDGVNTGIQQKQFRHAEKKESILHTIKVSNLNNYSLLRYFFSQRSVHPKFYLYPMLCFCLFEYSAILKVIFTLLPIILLNILYSLSCRHPYQIIIDPTYLYS